MQMKNLRVYKGFLNIVLKNKIEYEENRKLIMSKKNTVTLALNFLESEDKYYEQIFKSLLNDKKVKFRKKHMKDNDTLQIVRTDTLDDTFNLMNAFSSYINGKDETLEANLFYRTLPMVLELRLFEYLKNTKYSIEARKQIKNILFENYKMIKNYNELARIDSDKFFSYLFGFVMSIYINSNIENGNISKSEYLYLAHNINKISLKEINEILSTDMLIKQDGLNMSDSSIKKIGSTYVKQIERYKNER